MRDQSGGNDRRDCRAHGLGQEPLIGHAEFVLKRAQDALAFADCLDIENLKTAQRDQIPKLSAGQAPLIEARAIFVGCG